MGPFPFHPTATVGRFIVMKHLHLIVPDLWIDPFQDVARKLPALSTLLARGRTPPAARHLGAALGRALGHGEATPVAPYTYALDGGTPGDNVWMRADPVSLVMHRDFLVLAPATVFRLDAHEAQSLAETLSRHFATEGLAFEARHPRRWYLHLDQEPDMVTQPPEMAAGRRIDPYLPRGAATGPWLARLNEIQMLLHGHPVNEARESRGEPAVNSLWFWGAGRWAALSPADWDLVIGQHEILRALALATGRDSSPAESLQDLPRQAERVLAVLDNLQEAALAQDAGLWREQAMQLETRWLKPALRLIQSRRLAKLILEAPGEPGLCLELSPRDAWKIWRRA